MFYEIEVKKWQDAKKLSSYLTDYVYRGQREYSWKLETSLDRIKGIPGIVIPSIYENITLREFKRGAGNFVNDLPDMENNVEWLALMQHYGCPTRLLDFTYSYYIAAYFAVEQLSDKSAIWCINAKFIRGSELYGSRHEELASYRDKLQDLLSTASDKKDELDNFGITIIDPYIKNQRLLYQKGLFLSPNNISKSFQFNSIHGYMKTLGSMSHKHIEDDLENLKFHNIDIANVDLDLVHNALIIKVGLTKKIQEYALEDLKNMNISSMTLFPGLDGYARSFKTFRIFKSIFPFMEFEIKDQKVK